MAGSRVFLCHRNRLLSECLASALERLGHFDCFVIDPEIAVVSLAELATGARADLLLLDPTLGSGQAESIAQHFRALFPDSRLLVLVSAAAVDRVVEFAQMQSHGWILEDVSFSDVCSAIETVLAGRSFCSPELANALLAQLGRRDSRHNWLEHLDDIQLTSREREVLQLIAWERLSNKQIARRLHVSMFTVKNHVHNIIEKLGVEDRHQAVAYANRRRLLVGEPVES